MKPDESQPALDIADDSPLALLPFDAVDPRQRRIKPGGTSGQLDVTCPTTESFLWHAGDASAGTDLAWAAAGSCDGIVTVGYLTGSLPGQTNAGANDLFITMRRQDNTIAWSKQLGTSANDYATGVAVTSCQDPFIYVAGYSNGAFAGPNKGGSDAFLVKLNAAGSEVWRRQFGSTGNEQVWGVAKANNGTDDFITVIGSTTGNPANVTPPPAAGTTSLFIARYDASGNQVWIKQLGVNNKQVVARGVAVAGDGTAYVTGYTSTAIGGATFNGGSFDAFVVKYNAAGNHTGTALLGTSLYDQGYGIAVAEEGAQTDLYITGITNGAFAGFTNVGLNTYDAFVTRLGTDLSKQWLQQVGNSQNVTSYSIAYSNQSIFVAGSTQNDMDTNLALGSVDMLLMQFDTNGNRILTEYLGGNTFESAQALAVDPLGNAFLAGSTDGSFCSGPFGGGGRDALTLKLMPGCRVNSPEQRCKPGGASGDPHYSTFDGVAYDFQGSGDFVGALIDGVPGFEAQIRQCATGPASQVAVVHAVGVRIGDDVVEYQASGNVYVNGVLKTITKATALPDGGSIYKIGAGTGYVFAWPSGERFVARSFGSMMNVSLIVPKFRLGTLRGLFGDGDGNRANDLMMDRAGADLRAGLTFFEMYKDAASFASVWRVDPAAGDTQLIQHGTDCTNLAFPSAPLWLNNLTPQQQAAGEAACGNITDPAIKDTCVLDVGITGDNILAAAAAEHEATRANQGDTTPLVSGPRTVYFNSFEGSIGNEWDTIVTTVSPLGDRTFFGAFGNETVHLSLQNLTSHTEMTVSFDLYVMNAWDGDGPFGPHVWTATADGNEVASYTFSNTFSNQSYPDPSPLAGTNLAGTGALEVNTLAYPFGDSVYRIKLTIPHTGTSLGLDFSAAGLTGLFNESWGMTNFEVQGR